MAKGCLAALFGIGLNAPARSGPSAGGNARPTNGGMNEGDVHSGPGGYEGMGYSGGYAADYRAGQKNQPTAAELAAASAASDGSADTYDLTSEEAEDYGFEEGEA